MGWRYCYLKLNHSAATGTPGWQCVTSTASVCVLLLLRTGTGTTTSNTRLQSDSSCQPGPDRLVVLLNRQADNFKFKLNFQVEVQVVNSLTRRYYYILGTSLSTHWQAHNLKYACTQELAIQLELEVQVSGPASTSISTSSVVPVYSEYQYYY